MPLASVVGSYSGSQAAGVLTDSVKWQVTAEGIRLTSVRAQFSTCHRAWIFFSECNPGLNQPRLKFGIWTPPRIGQRLKPLWTQTVTLSRADHVTSGTYSWRQQLTRTFPHGAYFSIELYSRSNQTDQFYGVPDANAGAPLSSDDGQAFPR
jgi:hypothetical protein